MWTGLFSLEPLSLSGRQPPSPWRDLSSFCFCEDTSPIGLEPYPMTLCNLNNLYKELAYQSGYILR